MLTNERTTRNERLLLVANAMMTAARTAPKGKGIDIIEVALAMIAHRRSPEEIQFQHPHLSLAEIHAALGYYDDLKDEIDAEVERSLRETVRFRAQADESPIRARLSGMGRPR